MLSVNDPESSVHATRNREWMAFDARAAPGLARRCDVGLCVCFAGRIETSAMTYREIFTILNPNDRMPCPREHAP